MAVQVYGPPSDILNEENMYTSELVFIDDDITLELGAVNVRSGSTTRPSTTLAEQLRE